MKRLTLLLPALALVFGLTLLASCENKKASSIEETAAALAEAIASGMTPEEAVAMVSGTASSGTAAPASSGDEEEASGSGGGIFSRIFGGGKTASNSVSSGGDEEKAADSNVPSASGGGIGGIFSRIFGGGKTASSSISSGGDEETVGNNAPAAPSGNATRGDGVYGTEWPPNSVLAKYGASGMRLPTGASVLMYAETSESSGDELAIVFSSITSATETSINSWLTSHGWKAGNVVVMEGRSSFHFWDKDKITAQYSASIAGSGSTLNFRPGGASVSQGGGSGTLPAARGKLTITGLSAFNGKYVNVVVTFGDGKSGLVGIESVSGNSSSGTMRLPQISGGRAVVPLYTPSENNDLAAYAGNDTAAASSLFIVVMNTGTITSTTSQDITTVMANFDFVDMGMNTASVRFSGGNATVSFESMLGGLDLGGLNLGGRR